MTAPKPRLTLVCRCGKRFTQTHPQQKHCSYECRRNMDNAARTEQERQKRAQGIKRPKHNVKSGLSPAELLDRVVWQAWQNSDADWRRVIELRNPTMRFSERTI